MRTQTMGGTRPAGVEQGREQIKHRYLEALTLIERLHRRLLPHGWGEHGLTPFRGHYDFIALERSNHFHVNPPNCNYIGAGVHPYELQCRNG